MLAEVVDAVVGGDTHRDTHALEMLAPNGATISTLAIDNDDGGLSTRSPGLPNTPQDHDHPHWACGPRPSYQTAVGGVPA